MNEPQPKRRPMIEVVPFCPICLWALAWPSRSEGYGPFDEQPLHCRRCNWQGLSPRFRRLVIPE